MMKGMPFLFGDLSDHGGLAGIEGTDQEVRALANQLFGVLACDINTRLCIGVHDRYIGQPQRLENLGRDVNAALVILAIAGLEARTRQKHANLQRTALGSHDGRCGKGSSSCGGACKHVTAVG